MSGPSLEQYHRDLALGESPRSDRTRGTTPDHHDMSIVLRRGVHVGPNMSVRLDGARRRIISGAAPSRASS
jgi:hypothetical protein